MTSTQTKVRLTVETVETGYVSFAQIRIRQTLTVRTVETTAPGILAYRCQLEDEDAPTTSWEGLCDALDTPSRSNWRPKSEQMWRLLHVSSLAAIAEWGWSGENNDFVDLKRVSETPFTDLYSDEHQLVRLDPATEMLFNAKGAPLVVAQRADYIWWELHFRRYDIKATAKHLREHPHAFGVEINKCPEAEPGEHIDVSFTWRPDIETYRRAWKQCLDYGSRAPSTEFPRAVRDLDLLGLRAAGCMR